MMLAHLSDVHLGARPYRIEELGEDFFDAFREALESVVREGAEVIVVAGDLFHTPRPDNSTLVRAIDALRLPVSRGIPVIVSPGDHDTPKGRDKSPLEILARALGPPFIYPKPAPRGDLAEALRGTIVEVRGWAFAVAPYIRGSLEQRRAATRRVLEVQERLLRGRGGGKVFVGHFTIEGVAPWDPVASPSDLPRVRYAAMGHIHRRHISLDSEVPFAYPGSLCPLNEDEAMDSSRRGPLLVDLSGDEPVIHEVGVSLRPHVRVEVGASTVSEAERLAPAAVRRELAKIRYDDKKPLVHLTLYLPEASRSPVGLRGLARHLESSLGVLVRLTIQRAPGGAGGPVASPGPVASEEEVLSSMLGGSRELARLVLDLKAALASGDVEEAGRIAREITSPRYKALWLRILGGRRA